MHDAGSRGHDDRSPRFESGAQRQISNCASQLINDRLSLTFTRPLTADDGCTYTLSGDSTARPCDRVVTFDEAQKIIVAYSTIATCTEQACSTGKFVIL